ncbi:fanconi-associated nuclease 1 homolog [Magnolia sinica]|uniref:fanconi-associated nuclease 1 homolog n=1 Tax=Magnolia sinica TaxID=86752 RepID=UPI00265AF83E|nr:fanconi-associated nuclease 1 homolog [Magnolia sinica]
MWRSPRVIQLMGFDLSDLGPWFRMSNISYPEISDSQQAVEELRMAEYFRSLEFTKEPSKTSIREVLDLLSVSELREISTLVLSKSGSWRTMKFLVILFQLVLPTHKASVMLSLLGNTNLSGPIADLNPLRRLDRLHFQELELFLNQHLLKDYLLMCTRTAPPISLSFHEEISRQTFSSKPRRKQ